MEAVSSPGKKNYELAYKHDASAQGGLSLTHTEGFQKNQSCITSPALCVSTISFLHFKWHQHLFSHFYQLVVHVGVSGMATTVTLEKCGRNHGYRGLDNSSFCPDSQCCIVGGPDCIYSVIDMESVCKRVTASGLGVAVSVSKDAGRLVVA